MQKNKQINKQINKSINENFKNPLVSIVVPNYNTLSILDSYINNFLKISYKPYELIIVDDCSTDGSYEKLLEFQSKHPQIKIIRNEKNSGPSKTRNNGIKNSKGKYISFLESDMEVDPNFLNPIIKKLELDLSLGAAQSLVLDLNKKDVIQSDGLIYDPHTFNVYTKNVGVLKSKAKKDIKEKYTSIGAVGSVVRKDVLDLIGGYDEKIVHNIDDIDLGWRIWISGKKIILVPEATTYHVTYKKMGQREKVTPKVSSEFHSQKILRVFIKNYEFINLIRYSSWLYLTYFLRIILNLLKGNSAPLKGLWMSTKWLISNFKDNLNERKRIQSLRGFSDKELFNYIFMKGNYFENFKLVRDNLDRCEKVFNK